jgi:hypothetical protein
MSAQQTVEIMKKTLRPAPKARPWRRGFSFAKSPETDLKIPATRRKIPCSEIWSDDK